MEDKYQVIDKYVNDIYGVLYKPLVHKKVPIVIFCHGLGGNHSNGNEYAKHFLNMGLACYEFDFRNGGVLSKSGNDMTKMSVMTEVNDLLEIIDDIKNWDFVDVNNIILIGGSQGGLVSALVAAKLQEQIKGLILLYPAFVIPDIVHSTFNSIEEIPLTFDFHEWVTLGKIYALDIWDLDVYLEACKYDGNVVIIHGTSDDMVPYSYSIKANKLYKNSELKLIDRAGHGFYGDDLNLALDYIDEYLKDKIRYE